MKERIGILGSYCAARLQSPEKMHDCLYQTRTDKDVLKIHHEKRYFIFSVKVKNKNLTIYKALN